MSLFGKVQVPEDCLYGHMTPASAAFMIQVLLSSWEAQVIPAWKLNMFSLHWLLIVPCTCEIPEDPAQTFLRWDCCMFFLFLMWRCVWGKFNQEPRRPKRSLTIDPSSKSIYLITSTGQKIQVLFRWSLIPSTNHFWAFFVIWSKNGPLLFIPRSSWKVPLFLLDLGFPFFTRLPKPRFMMLVIWASNPGICPTSDVAEQKLITFLGEVGGAVLRLPVGGGPGQWCCCGCCVSTQAILAGETHTPGLRNRGTVQFLETWDSDTFRRPAHGRTISDEMHCLELNCDEMYDKDWHSS